MIGQDFDTLAQRVLYGCLAGYPEFRSVASAEATEESQRQMHAFLWDVISGIYAHPEALGIGAAADDWYEGWQLNNTKPELIKLMHRTLKPVTDFYAFLHALGVHGVVEGPRLRVSRADVRARRPQLQALRSFGVESDVQKDHMVLSSERYPALFPAWRLLSRVAQDASASQPQWKVASIPPFIFSRCLFDPTHDYMLPVLIGFDASSAESLAAFDQYLSAKGYTNQAYYHGLESWGIVYHKAGERRFSIEYDSRKRTQTHYVLRLNQFRLFWQRYDELDAGAWQLLVEMTPTCRGCGGCKAINIKTMGPFTTDVTGESKTLCPWYPGSEWWGHLSDAQIAGIKSLLEMQESILQDHR